MKKRVLILGSGASKNFCTEFGTGIDLISQIHKRVFIENNPYLSDILKETHLKDELEDFYKMLNSYRNTYGDGGSIDHFINIHRNKGEKHAQIAKFAIAAHILGYEGESETKAPIKETNKLFYEKGSWLTHFSAYIERIGLDSNSLNIVSFNYDRLLEQYLFYKFERDIFKLNQFIDRHIFHVYGQIDYLPFQNRETSTEYAYRNNDDEKLIAVQERFSLMYDDRQKYLPQIQDIISQADEIYSLGYAFDNLNNANIGLYKIAPDVKLTFKAFNKEEKTRIECKFSSHNNLQVVDKPTCANFIEKYFPSI